MNQRLWAHGFVSVMFALLGFACDPSDGGTSPTRDGSVGTTDGSVATCTRAKGGGMVGWYDAGMVG